MARIITATTAIHLAEIRSLFLQYERLLGVDLSFQDFENELADLPGKYAAPTGALLLAVDGSETMGCVALRGLEPSVCEMKRLFVRPWRRGQGLGRTLAETVIREARSMGYSTIRLDTLMTLNEAVRLYTSLGFRQIRPYYDNPLHGVSYWELKL